MNCLLYGAGWSLIALFMAAQRNQNAIDTCILYLKVRYEPWKVGCGRVTRQPGQVRKEAALTNSTRVTCPAFHLPIFLQINKFKTRHLIAFRVTKLL